jgi:predicted transcriptional regulator
MKNLTLSIVVVILLVGLFSSCKSTKGCGLTSDAETIELNMSEAILVAENN